MNTQFHTPSFGDEIFDLGDGTISTPTSSGFMGGNSVNNLNTTSNWYQHQQTPPSVGNVEKTIEFNTNISKRLNLCVR